MRGFFGLLLLCSLSRRQGCRRHRGVHHPQLRRHRAWQGGARCGYFPGWGVGWRERLFCGMICASFVRSAHALRCRRLWWGEDVTGFFLFWLWCCAGLKVSGGARGSCRALKAVLAASTTKLTADQTGRSIACQLCCMLVPTFLQRVAYK